MDNGTDSMLDMYLFETNSLMEQLDELLIEAEKVEEFSTDDVNEIFRIMHTIKGSSAMMEFTSLNQIAHHIEDLFFYIRENGMDSIAPELKKSLFNLMFKSTDMLRTEIEKVENNEPLTENIDNIIGEINSFLNKISNTSSAADSPEDTGGNDGPSVAELNMELANCPEDDAPFFIKVIFEEGCGMENLRAFMLVNALQDLGLPFRFYPDDVENNSASAQAIVEKGFFLALLEEEHIEKVINTITGTSHIHSYEVIENARLKGAQAEGDPDKAAEAKPADTVKDTPAPAASTSPAEAPAKQAPASRAHSGPVKQSLISVNLSKLDALVAIVGEIVITESMVTSSPDIQGLKLDNFMKSTRQLRKLTKDLQDLAMSLRMVPVSGVFQKMNRIVRDMKQKLNKDVRLTIIGEDTELDKSIVDGISDPIMHIVRNSMDHGVEVTSAERVAAGKDPQAEIILSATHTGSEVIIKVEDDGYGMDTEKILAKAANNGLLIKPESEYTKKEILGLLLLPGFSTNEEVTEYSGRGVGMDVVKRNVESVGGTVSISSELGQGSCTTLKIPLTMAIVDGMEIAVGQSIFTVPIANIRQSFKVSNEDVVYDAEGNEIVKCMNEFYPIIRVHQLYNVETEVTNIEDGILIWVEASDTSYCLFVDELLGEQQVVVKPLPSYLNNFNIKNSGISGCTILGNGNISIILDILSLYEMAQY
ncbi:MAG: chemotaxis protein CheA [Lachnospiraceae bacterium]|jgi:two-component system chemotaxis sensor kinase CheA|nr:chemotaxis protein CheA [Lachnospiraceae bacterium]MCI9470324.1 chemotaxis protein CheA [Lachnospiraceae bacterium]